MKTIKYFLLASVVSIATSTFTACESDKEFLTENAKSRYSSDHAYEKSSQIENILLTAYQRLEPLYYVDWGNPNLKGMSGTDIADTPYMRSSGQWADSNFTTWNAETGWVKSFWDQLYKIIASCNETAYGAELVFWDSEKHKAEILGEAATIKALAYLRLGEMWGGVPLVKDFSSSAKFDFVRESREDVFKYVIDCALEAYNVLPDTPREDGRPGKGAAAMILSEAYLALGVEANNPTYPETSADDCWDNAIFYADEVIRLHPMMRNRFGVRSIASDASTVRGTATYLANGNVYADLFYPGNYRYNQSANTESVWVVCGPTYEQTQDINGRVLNFSPASPALRDVPWGEGYNEAGAAGGPWQRFSAEFNPRGTSFAAANFPQYVGGFGVVALSPTHWAQFEMFAPENNAGTALNTDYRYQNDVSVRYEYKVTDPDHSKYGQVVKKEWLTTNPSQYSEMWTLFSKVIPLDEWSFPESDNDHGWTYTDRYIFRSAEAYLLKAEAQWRKSGKASSNAPALATINDLRSRSNANPLTTIDMDVILDERARELIYEENRWATFMRVEPEIWKERIYDYSMYGTRNAEPSEMWPNKIRWATSKMEIPFTLWPIPQTYRNLNTIEMEQNAGW